MSYANLTAELKSGPLSYRKGGRGPPILHLHGSGGPYVSPVLERLAGQHTIYMPTVPGFDATAIHPSVASVTALAMECGFADASRFARYYKDRFGEEPSIALRRAHRGC